MSNKICHYHIFKSSKCPFVAYLTEACGAVLVHGACLSCRLLLHLNDWTTYVTCAMDVRACPRHYFLNTIVVAGRELRTVTYSRVGIDPSQACHRAVQARDHVCTRSRSSLPFPRVTQRGMLLAMCLTSLFTNPSPRARRLWSSLVAP